MGGAIASDSAETMLIHDLSIVIPAAGVGERLGLGPKAILELGGASLLHWISQKARRVALEVIVAAPSALVETWASHCPGCRVIEGGESNLQSMTLLIEAASRPWLMNLNVSMPFVSVELMRNVVAAARQRGIAGAFLPIDVPLGQVQQGTVFDLQPGAAFALAQGPNAYRREDLLALIRLADDADWQCQSFLEIATRHNYPIAAVPGERSNIKITSPEDWAMAFHLRALLQ